MIRTTDPHGVEKLHHSAGRHHLEERPVEWWGLRVIGGAA